MTVDFENRIIAQGTENGIDWVTRQAPFYEAANGYVHLPEDHPWRALDLQWEHSGVVDVHGGITYGPDADGWIGFDALHVFDVWPGMPPWPSFEPSIEWTAEKVADEAKRLARLAGEAVRQ